MRRALPAVVSYTLILGACGYVGPVVPPSPELPNAITDLTAIERGDQIDIVFTAPVTTTDALPIKRFSEVDLRVGPAVTPFDFDRWADSAKPYDVSYPIPNGPEETKAAPIKRSIPVSEWRGKQVDIAVRTSVKKSGHFSQWSNRIALDVIPPLAPPEVKTEATRDGYKLSWPSERAGLHYQIKRQGPGDKAPLEIGTAENAEYVDTTSQWGTPYTYTVTARVGSAESLPSAPVSANAPDTFAPAVPAGLAALAAPASIELSWSRSPEPDLKGYYLFRSVNGAAFQKIGDLLSLPTYSDKNVEHGKEYRYAVSAIDQKANESARSAAAAVAY